MQIVVLCQCENIYAEANTNRMAGQVNKSSRKPTNFQNNIQQIRLKTDLLYFFPYIVKQPFNFHILLMA